MGRRLPGCVRGLWDRSVVLILPPWKFTYEMLQLRKGHWECPRSTPRNQNRRTSLIGLPRSWGSGSSSHPLRVLSFIFKSTCVMESLGRPMGDRRGEYQGLISKWTQVSGKTVALYYNTLNIFTKGKRNKDSANSMGCYETWMTVQSCSQVRQAG